MQVHILPFDQRIRPRRSAADALWHLANKPIHVWLRPLPDQPRFKTYRGVHHNVKDVLEGKTKP